jgi:hypothetical protein
MFLNGGFEGVAWFQNNIEKKKISENNSNDMIGLSYQRDKGSLIYVILCTWLDLVYFVSAINKHMTNPSIKHQIILKWIFWYLQGALHKLMLQFSGL